MSHGTAFFLVNAVGEVVATQATAMLIRAASARGYRVAVGGVGDLEVGVDGTVRARCRSLLPAAWPGPAEALEALRASPSAWVDLGEAAGAVLRTNPARDIARAPLHQAALAAMARLRDAGVPVANDPDGLLRAATKLYLDRLPPVFRPATLVTRDLERVRDFVAAQGGPCVLKPLHGTRGRDVFVVDGPDATNLPALLEVVSRDGYAMVQSWVPGAEEGDTRVVVLDGEVLEVGGAAAAIRRVPAPGERRSNLHAGGRAAPARLGDRMREVVAALAPSLRADGLRLVGLDFIGGVVIEANVYATGGLRDAERFTGADFSGAIVARLVETPGRRAAPHSSESD